MSALISSAAGLPAGGVLELAADLREPRAAVRRHPAHQLRRGEVLRLAADLPDAAIRLSPLLERPLDLLLDDRPDPVLQEVARLGVQVDRVEQRTPDIVLLLLVGAVPDADRPRPLVAGQVIEGELGDLTLAVDPVHDLEVVVLRLRDVRDEVEEVVGLPVEAERVEAPEHERGVADPARSGSPSCARRPGSPAARRSRPPRERRGRIRQALEGECRALEVGAPRVVWEVAVVEPVLPVVRGPDEPVVCVLVGLRRRVLGPRQRHEQRVALLHQRAGGGSRALEAHVHVGGEAQLHVRALARQTASW